MITTVYDYIFITSMFFIWIILLTNIILSFSGYMFYLKGYNNKGEYISNEDCPRVSILIPAHNEEVVIYKTVKSMVNLDYPIDKYEIIIINDNSSDNTYNQIKKVQSEHNSHNIRIITTTKENGGKGKANALNLGYKDSKGEYIVVYDADNIVEKKALRILVTKILGNLNIGAVIGMFRVINKERNILTRFINIETLSFQWISQAGRWNLFKLCTIPGTNFIVRKSIIEKIGGWDIKAISEDTEISFRIYNLGYKIAFEPHAVTWEQEPETLKVWFKQRSRWAKGNIYVVIKYIQQIFSQNKSVLFDIFYFIGIYFFFLSSVIISDALFIISVFTPMNINISGSFTAVWVLSYILFILQVAIALNIEKGEGNIKNIIIVMLMYFTYTQLWIVVVINSIYQYLKDIIFKREVKWYKTERF